MQCFECDGEYEKIVRVFETETVYGRLKIQDIEVLTCSICGDECLDDFNSRKIDELRQKFIKAKQSDDSIMNSSFGWM